MTHTESKMSDIKDMEGISMQRKEDDGLPF